MELGFQAIHEQVHCGGQGLGLVKYTILCPCYLSQHLEPEPTPSWLASTPQTFRCKQASLPHVGPWWERETGVEAQGPEPGHRQRGTGGCRVQLGAREWPGMWARFGCGSATLQLWDVRLPHLPEPPLARL